MSLNIWKLSQDSARMHHLKTLHKKISGGGAYFGTPLESRVSGVRALGIITCSQHRQRTFQKSLPLFFFSGESSVL